MSDRSQKETIFRVYAVSCPEYDQVEERLKILFDMMGGAARFFETNSRVALKVNLLRAAGPDKAVTTHPAVVAGVGRLIKRGGAEALIIDSPGSAFPYTPKILQRTYRKCGMDEASRAADLDLNFDTSSQIFSFPEGHLIKRFEVLAPLLEAQAVFNLCKLKTHVFMRMSGAVKNMFGIIPGRLKPGYHAKLRDPDRFAGMLLDLSTAVPPRISIMDAVVGMEGNGPSSGSPRQIGFLLASTHPLALDVVAGEMIGLSREEHPVLMAAEKRGVLPTRLEEIELVGAEMDELRIPGYRLPETVLRGTGLGAFPGFLRKPVDWLVRTGTSLKPYVNTGKCVACGACVEACPVEAILLIKGKYSFIKTKECIRCYCCHEMCPYDAVELRRSRIFRLLSS